jgi:rhodanese-related sulfurtransferase
MFEFYKKNKKIIYFVLIQNVVLLLLLGIFFYYKYYLGLKNDSYLFPPNFEANSSIDIRALNDSYIQDGPFLRDKYGNRSIVDNNFGISLEELISKKDKSEKIEIIDVREIEEYEAGHIIDSKHYRVMDLELEAIKEIYNISNEEFESILFVLVCHDGGRGLAKAKDFNKDNIKYLIGGIESISDDKARSIKISGPVFADYKIFDEDYQNDFQVDLDKAIILIKEGPNTFVIDGRHVGYYNERHIKGSIHIKIGHMTSNEYNEALEVVLKHRDDPIIIFVDRYSELFYANLLILRLTRDHGFEKENFNIVFNQFSLLKDYSEIEFTSTLE